MKVMMMLEKEFFQVLLTPEKIRLMELQWDCVKQFKKYVFSDDMEVLNQFVVIEEKEIIAENNQYNSTEKYIISNKIHFHLC